MYVIHTLSLSRRYLFSKWCRHEAHEAAIKNIPLVPVYNGDRAIQKEIIDGLDRRDAISNAVFSKNLVKVQDVSESSETTTRRIVEAVVKHARCVEHAGKQTNRRERHGVGSIRRGFPRA